jgi:purine-nucleoside phosphorylase
MNTSKGDTTSDTGVDRRMGVLINTSMFNTTTTNIYTRVNQQSNNTRSVNVHGTSLDDTTIYIKILIHFVYALLHSINKS